MARVRALVWLLLIAMALAGCGPAGSNPGIAPLPTTRPPENQPTQVAVVAASARVQRVLSGVAAGPGNVTPIPPLQDDLFRELAEGGIVATDSNGEARVDFRDCATVHVFQRSQLIAASCSRSNLASGNPTCLSGTVAFDNKCTDQVAIETRSAQIELQGTWLTVTYLPDRRLSLVMLYEGEAKVWPVRDFDNRTLGEPVTVGARHFWFSDPGADASTVAGLRGRRVYPFEMAAPVLDDLGMREWQPRIRQRAEEAGLDYPADLWDEVPTLTPEPRPATRTSSPTPRATLTISPTPPATLTPTRTVTATRAITPTATVTPTSRATWTPSRTPIIPATWTPTATSRIAAIETARAAAAQTYIAALTATARAGPIIR